MFPHKETVNIMIKCIDKEGDNIEKYLLFEINAFFIMRFKTYSCSAV